MKKKYYPIFNALKNSLKKPLQKIHSDWTLDFSSYDIFSLSQHAHLKKMAIKYLLEWGTMCTKESHANVQEKLSEFLGKERVRFFPSLVFAQKVLFSALSYKEALFFIDAGSKLSLLQAVNASPAKVIYYRHQDCNHLESLLKEHQEMSSFTKVIISESIFEKNGETCQLKPLVELSNLYHTFLLIDDSHSLGVLGKDGMGLAAKRPEVDIIMGTLTHAAGTFGAYVALSHVMLQYLKTFELNMTHAMLPPATLGAIDATLELIPAMHSERKKILDLSNLLKHELKQRGFFIGKSESHIIPLPPECDQIIQTLHDAKIRMNLSPQPQFILNLHHSGDKLSFLLEALESISSY